MFRSLARCFLILAAGVVPLDLYGFGATTPSNRVLIVHDELPQMAVFRK